MQCPLCQCQECTNYPNHLRQTSFKCKNCGTFTLNAVAANVIGDDGYKLAAYVFDKNQLGITPTFYSSQRSLTKEFALTGHSLQEDAPAGSVGVDTAIETFPKTVAERLDRVLLNLAAVTKHLGQQIKIGSEGVNPLLCAQNSSEVLFIIEQFAQEGHVKGKTTCLPTEISLTAKGWNRVADLQRGLYGPLNKQVFVAMSFDESLDSAWTDGLKLGIADCGYDALRVDRKQHNEKICDVIIAEIRKSKFLVADFTLHRNGVYFEAGMMMGLGRPVIFACRKEDMANAHFDTRQYNHIEWETPAELREELKSRIQATIAP
jgi:hypothetical protein